MVAFFVDFFFFVAFFFVVVFFFVGAFLELLFLLPELLLEVIFAAEFFVDLLLVDVFLDEVLLLEADLLALFLPELCFDDPLLEDLEDLDVLPRFNPLPAVMLRAVFSPTPFTRAIRSSVEANLPPRRRSLMMRSAITGPTPLTVCKSSALALFTSSAKAGAAIRVRASNAAFSPDLKAENKFE